MRGDFYLKTIEFRDNALYLLDQNALPQEKKYVVCHDHQEVRNAIINMTTRGAPAIGIAAAFAMVLAIGKYKNSDYSKMLTYLREAKTYLSSARPTAVNLVWALNRMEKVWETSSGLKPEEIKRLMLSEAMDIMSEDLQINKMIGSYGSTLIPSKADILTHCNAGAFATGGFGTALGVIRTAFEQNKEIHVYADETRPLLQGARLTTTELIEAKIPVTLVADNMAGHLMQQKRVDLVIVGADRIAVNGDTANKIGTYSLAVLAAYHNIPFYIAAPLSTFDISLTAGEHIPIEERSPDELRAWKGILIAPPDVNAYNPAFDITPNELITAIITEKGIITPPYKDKILRIIDPKEIK